MSRVSGPVLLSLAACGRLGFASHAGDAPGGEGDDVGVDAARCVPVAEVCNGVDDNCNGQIDEGCPCTPFAITLQETGPRTPIPIWLGDRYAVLGDDGSGALELTIVDAGGSAGAAVPIGITGTFGGAAWTGSVLALTWTAAGVQQLATYDPGTQTLGAAIAVSAQVSPFAGNVRWADGRFVVVYTSTFAGGAMRTVALDGSLGPEIRLTAAAQVSPAFASGGGLTLACTLDQAPALLAVDASGTVTSTPIDLVVGGSECGVAGGSAGFLVGWQSPMFGSGDFVVLAPDGSMVATTPYPAPVTAGALYFTTASAADGDRFAISASDRAGGVVEMSTFALDRTGTLVEAPVIADSAPTSAWDGPVIAAAAGRRASAIAYDITSSPYPLRFVQTCP